MMELGQKPVDVIRIRIERLFGLEAGKKALMVRPPCAA